MQSILELAFIGMVISLIALMAGSYLSPAPLAERWQFFMPKKQEAREIYH
jgi:hypothetical protein